MQDLSDYKKKLKPTILAEAERSFCENGIRAVKMDDIARNLGISKRTLYEIYSNKEDVLVDVIQDILKRHKARLNDFAANCKNVIDVMLEALRTQIEFSAHTHADFFKDLNRYPAAEVILSEYIDGQEKEACDFFYKGVEQGYFRPEIDYSVFERICTGSLKMIRTDSSYKNLSYQQLFVNYQCVLIRGISTDKGLLCLEEFIKQYI